MCNKAKSATLLFFTKFSCQPDSTTFHSSQITFHPLVTAIAIGAFVFAAFLDMFSLVIIGVLLSLVLTFLFVFNIGFFVALHSIYLDNENSMQLWKNLKILN